MGDELVGSSPDTVTVLDEQCGLYLAMGMSIREYWDEDPALVKYYRQAFRLRQELDNQRAWIQGYYFYAALAQVAPLYQPFSKSPKAQPYLSEPLPLGESKGVKQKEKNEEAIKKSAAYLEQWAITVNKQFRKKGGGVNGC